MKEDSRIARRQKTARKFVQSVLRIKDVSEYELWPILFDPEGCFL